MTYILILRRIQLLPAYLGFARTVAPASDVTLEPFLLLSSTNWSSDCVSIYQGARPKPAGMHGQTH
jgi:hypothetical protein